MLFGFSPPGIKRRWALPGILGAPSLGYKMVNWIERVEFVASEKTLGQGEGDKNEDDEYFDLLHNI